MDITDILKDLMSPRSASAGTTTKTPTSVSSGSGGRSGFGRMGSGGGKSTRIGSRLPTSFVEDEEESTIVHLLPTETEEETEEHHNNDDDNDSDNILAEDNMDDVNNESFITQYPSGIENMSSNNPQHRHHHQETTSKLEFREQQLHHSPNNHFHTSPQVSNSPCPTTMVGTTLCQQQQHSQLARYQLHIIPSLLSCSEDDTEQEEEEENSTIVRPLPGDDDSKAPPAKPVLYDSTNTTNFHQLWQQQLRQPRSSCNSSSRLPIQEVIVKNKKKKDKDDDSIKEGGGGVEIVDVIMEHFAFSPRWDNIGVAGEGGFGDGGDAAPGNKNVAVDDESTIIQLLPGGEVHEYDDDVSDIAFADKRMHLSKNGQKGMQQSSSSSSKKKAATVAAVFVTLTVCLGVGYKAGNIMTSKSSSSSSLAFTSLTLDDCLALRNATTSRGDGGIGKQSNKHRREHGQETFQTRSLEESDWKRVR